MTQDQGKSVRIGDIVQASPTSGWKGCLVIVTEIKSFGIQGFTPMPPEGGMAFIRLAWANIEPTGGRAVWALKDDEET